MSLFRKPKPIEDFDEITKFIPSSLDRAAVNVARKHYLEAKYAPDGELHLVLEGDKLSPALEQLQVNLGGDALTTIEYINTLDPTAPRLRGWLAKNVRY